MKPVDTNGTQISPARKCLIVIEREPFALVLYDGTMAGIGYF